MLVNIEGGYYLELVMPLTLYALFSFSSMRLLLFWFGVVVCMHCALNNGLFTAVSHYNEKEV